MSKFPVFAFLFAGAAAMVIAVYFFVPLQSLPYIGNTSSSSQKSPIPFEVLSEGENAPAVSTQVNYRVTTPEELSELWTLVYGNNGPAIPSIDFEKYEVLGVFDGSHSTGGYKIQVERIVDVDARRTVTIVHTAPGTGCAVSGNTTAPFQIIRVPKTIFGLDHVDTITTTTACTR